MKKCFEKPISTFTPNLTKIKNLNLFVDQSETKINIDNAEINIPILTDASNSLNQKQKQKSQTKLLLDSQRKQLLQLPRPWKVLGKEIMN